MEGINPITAIIVAAGKGLRFGSELPKQFLTLNEKPIICFSIESFFEAFPKIEIIIVVSSDFLELITQICNSFFYHKMNQIQFVEGGNTRFESSQKGIQEVGNSGIIFVHDAARPFASPALIKKCYEQAILFGNAIPAVKIADSIRKWNNEKFEVINREDLRVIQTPQTFSASTLKKAFNQEFQHHFTDESTVVEYLGEKINLIEGEKNNFKITTVQDFKYAEYIINRNK